MYHPDILLLFPLSLFWGVRYISLSPFLPFPPCVWVYRHASCKDIFFLNFIPYQLLHMWLFCYLRCLWKRNKGFKSELWKWGGAWKYIKFKDAAPFSARIFRMFLNSHHYSPALPLCERDEECTGMWDSQRLLFKLLTHCVPQGFCRFFRVLVSKKTSF